MRKPAQSYGIADDERDEFGLEMKAAVAGIDERVRRQIARR